MLILTFNNNGFSENTKEEEDQIFIKQDENYLVIIEN